MNRHVIAALLFVLLPGALLCQPLLQEGFESTMDPRITVITAGTALLAPGVISTAHFGSSHAFAFGRSYCGVNCFSSPYGAYNQPYFTIVRITFPSPTAVGNLSFKWAEIGGNWGSQGMVNLDNTVYGTEITHSVGIYPNSNHVFDQSVKTWSHALNQTVSVIDIWVADITNASQVWMDDLVIESPMSVDAGADQFITLGYGPQSVTLTASIEGGTQPYSVLWSTTETTPSITVSPTTTTTYTVSVTDAANGVASDQVTVYVTDVRCGHNLDKIVLCHNGHMICVAAAAVPAHLQHGDQLGACPVPKHAAVAADGFSLSQNYPNPFNPSTTITFTIPTDGQVKFVVLDQLGREIQRPVDGVIGAGTHQVEIRADGLPSGMYFYRIEWGGQVLAGRMTMIK